MSERCSVCGGHWYAHVDHGAGRIEPLCTGCYCWYAHFALRGLVAFPCAS